MSKWTQALREGTVAGSIASILSTVALVVAGRRENGRAAAPVNAISHWFWGAPALQEDRPSLRHTIAGYAVHHGASVFWGTLHARAWGCRPEAKQLIPAAVGAAGAAAVACFVDYRLTPERLTPGFQHRLSLGSMAAVYACFAVGLAMGSMAMAKPRR